MDKEFLTDFIYSHFGKCDLSTLQEAAWCYKCNFDFDDYTYYNLKTKVSADWVENGCSKLVFGFSDLKKDGKEYVIKIPFFGQRYFEEEEWHQYDYEFAGSCHIELEQDWNYCEAEEKIYQKSVEWGLSDIFAATEYICSIGDVQFYASELVGYSFNNDAYLDCSKELKEDSQSFSKYSHARISRIAFRPILLQYGEDFCCDLIDFLETYDIDDIHDSNVGTTDDGSFKILDYSNFRD